MRRNLTGVEYVHKFQDKSEYDALEKDAGRYRYLRKFAGGVTIVDHPIDEKIAANRDEILDVQIAKKKGIVI